MNMNIVAFEADYEEVKDEFGEEWSKPAWYILNEYSYGPSEFLESFDEAYDLVEVLIESQLNDPTTKDDETLMRRRIDDFFTEIAHEKRRRRKMGVVLGDVYDE
jgi:hypothetical protein